MNKLLDRIGVAKSDLEVFEIVDDAYGFAEINAEQAAELGEASGIDYFGYWA
jgi:hypothetical protein